MPPNGAPSFFFTVVRVILNTSLVIPLPSRRLIWMAPHFILSPHSLTLLTRLRIICLHLSQLSCPSYHTRCSLVSLLSISQPCRHLFSHQGFVTIISFSLHLPKDFSSSSEKQHVVVIIFSGKFFSTSYQTLLPVWVRCLISVLPWQLGLPQHHIYPGLLLAICFSIILAR